MNQNIPKTVVLNFVAPINYPATRNLRNFCCQMINEKREHLIIQISSQGGSLFEGFALYHFLRSLPIKITMHNIGSIESIANVVFLGADTRFACESSYFLFHQFDWTYPEKQTLLQSKIEEHSLLLTTDMNRYLGTLKKHTSFTDEILNEIQSINKATVVSSGRAKEIGIVQKVTEAKIPTDAQVLNLEF